MTVSELHAVMVGGFATIAGGVLAGYIQMGVNPGHLIAASVMSAPAALVIAKLLYPGDRALGDRRRRRDPGNQDRRQRGRSGRQRHHRRPQAGAQRRRHADRLHRPDRRAWITVLGFFDGIIDGQMLGGDRRSSTSAAAARSPSTAGFFPGSMATLFGTLLAPLAFVMGVPWVDAAAVGNLLGVKMTVNEFVSYGLLSQHIAAEDLQPQLGLIIATYALCGFANFSSIGIQIGGLGSLEPSLRPTLSKIGIRAMFGGALASFMTATVAGILL